MGRLGFRPARSRMGGVGHHQSYASPPPRPRPPPPPPTDPGRCFDDLYNLVYDQAFVVVAWNRVRGNKGARSAGVDRVAPRDLDGEVVEFLEHVRVELKTRTFTPVKVREKKIPKAGGKFRRLEIPTSADRVVQATLKRVLEPIFEADFLPSSHGFRPRRRAQDAIAEIRFLAPPARNYEWVFEADITACFDEIDHTALMSRVRQRVADKRVLALVKAFLRSGILSEDGSDRATITGIPRAGSSHRCWRPSPCPCSTSISPRSMRRSARHGLAPNTADRVAPCTASSATQTTSWAWSAAPATTPTRSGTKSPSVLAPIGSRLSETKTRVCHIDEGFDFLGWRNQRRRWRGRTGKRAVCT